MIQDAQGYALSGATRESAALYDQAVRAFNLGYGDSAGLFDKAREASPEFAMAALGKAWLFAVANDPKFLAMARPLLSTATGFAMDEREQAHFAALEQATTGERMHAVTILDRHLMRYPFDLLAHQAAMLLDGLLGRFAYLRARAARALPLWSKDQAGYGVMLSFHAFGLEEAGEYARSEDEAREAAEREPHGFWPHHTVAHVMEMMGRPEDGIGWMEARKPLWSAPENLTQVHIWWHKTLFHVELGQAEEALAIYDGPMMETLRPLALNLCNLSALLWRLHALGHDVSDRWRALAPLWEGHADGRCLAFCDLHAAMADLGAGDEARVEQRLATMRETAAGTDEPAALYRDVGIPMTEAFLAFHRGRYDQTVSLLHPIRYESWRIGGSHAQRDIVDWTLTEAALRGGMRDVALALAHERLGTRPRSFVNRAFLHRAERIAA